MTKKSKFGVYATSALVAGLVGGFVGFPVFAENPVNISIVEKVDDGSGHYKDWEDITGAMPGMSYSAIPRVLNDGSMATWVRMCLSESAISTTGDVMMLPANTFGISINENYWNLESGNSGDPAAGNCYRYNIELGVGEETEPLFYEINLSSELGNEYQNATFSLHLDAYAGEDIPPEPTPTPTPTPSNPDTGDFTNSEPLTTVGYVSLTLGAAILIILVFCLLKKYLVKK